ncbi:MAG TPA: FoF1 ATP synthase subunit gamma [Myxococcaceae bacterium]|nr:FoF1 ATP synthase subunit gamma [Myxococcaceae bacterium]
MAKLLELRERIRAVENIQTITRTLATVAAARLARARRRAAGLRVYARSIREILHRQQTHLARAGDAGDAALSFLQGRRPVRNVVLFVLTSDRGMCGGYNLDLCRCALAFWEERKKAHQRVAFVLKGRKGARYLSRLGAEILHQEGWRRELIGAVDVERLLGVLVAPYRSRAAEEVHVAYTDFRSPIHRGPRVVRLFPIELLPGQEEPPGKAERWFYEPFARAVLDELVAVYIRAQLCDVLLESYASEQGARMITMEEATERADRTLQECRAQHNRLRRETVTTDLLGALFASRAAKGAGTYTGKAGSRRRP